MAKQFIRIRDNVANANLVTLEKASATVILEGQFVALDANGLAIVALATSTGVAYAPADALAGAVTVQVVNDKNVVFEGTSSANFAEAQRGVTYDIISSAGVQTINIAASTLNVVKVIPDNDAGTVGAATAVKLSINATI